MGVVGVVDFPTSLPLGKLGAPPREELPGTREKAKASAVSVAFTLSHRAGDVVHPC